MYLFPSSFLPVASQLVDHKVIRHDCEPRHDPCLPVVDRLDLAECGRFVAGQISPLAGTLFHGVRVSEMSDFRRPTLPGDKPSYGALK